MTEQQNQPTIEQQLAPADPYQAANWLYDRHERVRGLVDRIAPWKSLDSDSVTIDVDAIAQAVHDDAANDAEWEAYRDRHPEPHTSMFTEEGEEAWEVWQQAGPKPTELAAAYGVMSSGEKILVRLLATLSPTVPVRWYVGDVQGIDRAGAAVLADWLAIVRAQLPDWLYPDANTGNRIAVDTDQGVRVFAEDSAAGLVAAASYPLAADGQEDPRFPLAGPAHGDRVRLSYRNGERVVEGIWLEFAGQPLLRVDDGQEVVDLVVDGDWQRREIIERAPRRPQLVAAAVKAGDQLLVDGYTREVVKTEMVEPAPNEIAVRVSFVNGGTITVPTGHLFDLVERDRG